MTSHGDHSNPVLLSYSLFFNDKTFLRDVSHLTSSPQWWHTHNRRSLGEWIAFFIFTAFVLFTLLLGKERALLFTLVSGKGQNWTEIRSSPGHYFGDWCFKGLYKISRLGVNWTLTVLGKGAAWTTAARHLHIYNAKNMSIPPWYW